MFKLTVGDSLGGKRNIPRDNLVDLVSNCASLQGTSCKRLTWLATAKTRVGGTIGAADILNPAKQQNARPVARAL